MNEPPALRIGLVGLGWPGEQHAAAAMALPNITLEAACDVQPARLQKFAAQFSPRKRYTDYDVMLADPDVDAVVISLPNFLHYPATLSALRSGKHVLCEKPPTLTVAEIEHIRAETEMRGLTYFFGRQSRFSAKMRVARRLVMDGVLGKIYFVRAERVRSRGIPAWGGGWFLEKARSGGGAVVDIGIHALDAAWYLLGCPLPLTVSAQVSSQFGHLVPPGIHYDVEDTGFAFIRFEGGVVLHLETAWAANVTDIVPESSWAGHEIENTTLYGDAGTLRLEPGTLFTFSNLERQSNSLVPEENKDAFVEQLSSFAHSIQTGAISANSAIQAISLMKMLNAIYDSSAKGREIAFA